MIATSINNLPRTILSVGTASLLALALVLPQAANAQTTNAQLQAQINALLAQIQTLQAQLPQQSGSLVCPHTWSTNLNVGSTGTDVQKLQKFLNSSADTQVALSGVGSPGQETAYYGPATGAAVAKFQTKYRNEILTPNGLVNPTTFFGPATRAKLNTLCVTAPVVNKPTTPTTPVVEKPTTPALKDGAYVERFKVSSAKDTNLEENQKNAEVMDVEFKVVDGDIIINRVEVAFEYMSGTEDEPWDTFQEVSLWSNGDRIAKKDASIEKNWMEDSPYIGAHTMRFSGLNIRADEDETFEFSVAVTIQKHVDGADTGLSWDMFIPTTGIRFLDSDKVADTIGDSSDKVNFDINAEGNEDELSIRSSDKDPEAQVLKLESNKASDWMTIFAFDLDTDDSTNDIEVRSLPVSFTVSTGTVNTFVSDVRLKINNTTYRDVTTVDGLSNYMIFKFKSNEFVIDAGDRETVEVQAKFRSLATIYEGTTIEGTASSSAVRAEGADDLRDNQLSGAATSDLHELRTSGAEVKNQNNSTAKLIVNSTDDITDDEGSFTISFNITAFSSDLYINKSAERGNTLGTAGANYVMLDSVGSIISDGSVVASLTSDAKTSGSQFIVREGETKRFTLNVEFDPDTSGFYTMRLHSFNYATSGVNPTTQQKALPTQKYETPTLSI